MSYFDSEMERSFTKLAKKKGWIKENPIVRTASASSMEPSSNVLVDICRLAEALREKGYENQAQEIEDNVFAYKTAEVHLYNVHDEDGSDFLELAHPEGDQKIEETQDGHGELAFPPFCSNKEV